MLNPPTRTTFSFLPLLTLLAGLAIGWFGHQWAASPTSQPVAASATTPASDLQSPPIESPRARHETTAQPTPQIRAENVVPPDRQFLALIHSESPEALVDTLDRLRHDADPRWNVFHNLFVQQLAIWVKASQSTTAMVYAQAYLARFYFDADVMQALAVAQLESRQTAAAIQTLYTLLANSDSSTRSDSLRQQIHALVADHDRALTARQQWDELAMLYAELIVAEPAYVPYFLRQAEIDAERLQFTTALQALEHVYPDPVLGDEARTLAERIARLQQGEVQIPLTARGGSYALQATVANQLTLNLLIDTGASISALPRRALYAVREHSKTYIDTIAVSTANGTVQAPRYRIDSVTLEGLTVRNIEFVILEELPPDQGLLGMNLLNQFHFEIDQNRQLLLLSPR